MKGRQTFDLEDVLIMMKALGRHFGEDCEIVLHDFSRGFDRSIIAIENGHVTGREVGSSITTNGLELLSDDSKQVGDGIYNYFSSTPDGRSIRSSTAILRGPNGEIRGSLCINQDITRFRVAEDALRSMTHPETPREGNEIFFKNVDQLLDHYILECSTVIGRPPNSMNKDELFRSIQFLEDRGVFRITKAGDRVCAAFGITKYQLYRHLEVIRGEKHKKEA